MGLSSLQRVQEHLTPTMTAARKKTIPILIFPCAFIAWIGLFVTTATASPRKRVEIDKTHQQLRAYEGLRLILRCRVSTGRGGSTPGGRFYVQGKERMHYSSRYQNAPMSYSIHLRGHYFIHGYSFVPNYPASHGCIRVPLRNGNPAKRLFEWIDIGTPVTILGRWRR